jgi:hypothetical protein
MRTLIAIAFFMITASSAYSVEINDGFYCEKDEHKVQFVFEKKKSADGKGAMPDCSVREFDTGVKTLPEYTAIGFNGCVDRLNQMAKKGYICSQRDNTK